MIIFEDEKMTVYMIHDKIYYLDAPRRLSKRQITAIRGRLKDTTGSVNKVVLVKKDEPFKGFDVTIIPIDKVIDTKKEKVLSIADATKINAL